jgi:hypothetical protein
MNFNWVQGLLLCKATTTTQAIVGAVRCIPSTTGSGDAYLNSYRIMRTVC